MFTASGAAAVRVGLARCLGISPPALEVLGVGSGQDAAGQFSSWPERDGSGMVVGIVRRYGDGSKKHMSGGSAGLYYANSWRDTAGPVLLPEGGSDTAALLTMGLSAIGRPSNTGGIQHLAKLLRHDRRQVVAIGENDRKPDRVGAMAQCPSGCPGCSWCWPGKFGAKATAERLTQLLGRRVHWRQVFGAKDSRAWLIAHGCDGQAFLDSLRRQPAEAK
jgi:hypothetical protein